MPLDRNDPSRGVFQGLHGSVVCPGSDLQAFAYPGHSLMVSGGNLNGAPTRSSI